MLTALSIRDVVLVERLDLAFGPGLTVLTGETGAGKSILLDSLGLALGARPEAALVRAGCEQASVSASFSLPAGHAASAALEELGLPVEEELVLRRVVLKDGRSRGFVNDQPVGVTLLRRIGGLLVEVQGQHEQVGLLDQATHLALLDAFGVPVAARAAVAVGWRGWKAAANLAEAARSKAAEAERDREWLEFTVEELGRLAPEPGEEDRLAAERQSLQQSERRAEAVTTALAELVPRDRRAGSPGAAIRAAARALQRLETERGGPAREDRPDSHGLPANPAASALAALERAEEALAEGERELVRLGHQAEADPRRLETLEERLFALRAAARKHNVAVGELPELLFAMRGKLAALQTGADELASLEQAARTARAAYVAASVQLGEARRQAAVRLERAVARELPPLRLDKTRFVVEVSGLAESAWGPLGMEAVRFLIATNPGQEPGPLGKVASGGELSRLMLGLKVVLARGSPAPTLIFDEVDSGIGGATAAAVGERLARVAERLQVLVVTHSPQVAARGGAHLCVAKAAARGRAATRVDRLDGRARREEIARMLAGEIVTEAARAAADSLLGNAA
jgi:DNA repair protein RecN (Recombination protein N)